MLILIKKIQTLNTIKNQVEKEANEAFKAYSLAIEKLVKTKEEIYLYKKELDELLENNEN